MGEEIRSADIQRKTSETEILLQIGLDGTGRHQIDTEIPFLSHMLTLFSVHSLCDLKITARGDIEVDDHHTVEDIGICLGQGIKQALGTNEVLTVMVKLPCPWMKLWCEQSLIYQADLIWYTVQFCLRKK